MNTTPEQRRLLLQAFALSALGPIGMASEANCPGVDSRAVLQPKGRVLRVVQGNPPQSLNRIARSAADGDTIEIEAGDYFADVASWPQSDLVLRGVGGRPRLFAGGKSAEGKAIFVVSGKRTRIENLEFYDAKVPDRNGAGIRIENGPVAIVNCKFLGNEMGVLTNNDRSIELDIEDSIFADSGSARLGHNLYVGSIARLHVTGCWFARAKVGHLLKTRASSNLIQYSRLTGESATASYELEFPFGGNAVVIGNLIQQGPNSENSAIVSFGAEGYPERVNTLTMAFNTIVNDRLLGSTFVRVFKGARDVCLFDNLLVGRGSMEINAPQTMRGNLEAARNDFANPMTYDYRLRLTSSLVGRAGMKGVSPEQSLRPTREYVHEATSCPLDIGSGLTPLSPGAFQRLA